MNMDRLSPFGDLPIDSIRLAAGGGGGAVDEVRVRVRSRGLNLNLNAIILREHVGSAVQLSSANSSFLQQFLHPNPQSGNSSKSHQFKAELLLLLLLDSQHKSSPRGRINPRAALFAPISVCVWVFARGPKQPPAQWFGLVWFGLAALTETKTSPTTTTRSRHAISGGVIECRLWRSSLRARLHISSSVQLPRPPSRSLFLAQDDE